MREELPMALAHQVETAMTSERAGPPMNAGRERNVGLWLLLVIILVGWGLALARLGHRSLWADEGFTAYMADRARSGREIVSILRHFTESPLQIWVATGMTGFSRTETALRLPSAVAAVLTLPVLYAIGRKLVNRPAGLSAAALLAISPFAVGYAQEARTIALLELLSCLSLWFLLQAMERQRWAWWAGHALTTALLVYCHYFAWLVVAAELVYAVPVLLWETVARRRIDRRALALFASLSVVALLYLPWAPSFLEFLSRQASRAASSQQASANRVQISGDFMQQMVWFFGAKAGGWRLYSFVVGAALGILAIAWRRRWRSLLLVATWFAAPLLVLALVPAKHAFNFRYLVFLLPLFLLLTATGVASVCSLVVGSRDTARTPLLRPLFAAGLTVLLFVPADLPSLREHYAWEKENWRGIASFVGESFLSDELVYVSPEFWAHPLFYYQPSLEPYLAGGSPENTSQLESALQQSAGLWFLRSAGSLGDPTGQLTSWVTDHGFELLIDGFQCGWGIHVYYLRSDGAAEARHAELMHLAEDFCPTDPRFTAPQS